MGPAGSPAKEQENKTRAIHSPNTCNTQINALCRRAVIGLFLHTRMQLRSETEFMGVLKAQSVRFCGPLEALSNGAVAHSWLRLCSEGFKVPFWAGSTSKAPCSRCCQAKQPEYRQNVMEIFGITHGSGKFCELGAGRNPSRCGSASSDWP